MRVKPLYIFPLMFMLVACQWIQQHPEQVKELEQDVEEVIEDVEKDVVPMIPIIESIVI